MKEKYDRIGLGYQQTRKADAFLVEQFFRYLQASAKKQYLDIGSGSGNYTIALAQKGLSIFGVEPSDHMLQLARQNDQHIQWIKGKAEQLPLAAACVDGAMAGLTIHHWTDLAQGFQEIFRVLKPGAPFVIFTSTPRQMQGYWLNHYFPKMLARSIHQMPRQAIITQHLTKAGFTQLQCEAYAVRPDLEDLFLYAGKDRPALYFEAAVRRGISSFADLANREEVNQGLAQLKNDLANGQFSSIQRQYHHTAGDYLFVSAQKPIVTSEHF
ncbi:MAG: methyltransferase domain-containing protein [Bacteroidota bacterium]